MSEASSTANRFWSHVDQGNLDGCWPWTASLNSNGYGQFMLKAVRASSGVWIRHPRISSRVAWWLTFGAIPDGQIICHRCDNPPCCNPTHLFLGTKKDNTQDMVSKGRTPTGEHHVNAKLTADDVRFIRESKETGASMARRFGVGQMQISRIRSGQRWKHLN